MKKYFMVFFCIIFLFSFSIHAQNGDFELNGINQQGLYNTISSLKGVLENRVLNSPGLAIGSAAAKVAIGATCEFTIDGIFYSKAPAEVAFTATTHDIVAPTGITKERYYVLSITSNGTVTITAGTVALEGYGDSPAFSSLPSDCCVLGYVKLVVKAGQTFDATTTGLNNSTVLKSVTYVNTSFLKKYIGPKTPKITVDFVQQ